MIILELDCSLEHLGPENQVPLFPIPHKINNQFGKYHVKWITKKSVLLELAGHSGVIFHFEYKPLSSAQIRSNDVNNAISWDK